MKATIEVKLKPFIVPNYVVQDSGQGEDEQGIAHPLSALDAETLDALCREFYDNAFKKAGLHPPPKVRHVRES